MSVGAASKLWLQMYYRVVSRQFNCVALFYSVRMMRVRLVLGTTATPGLQLSWLQSIFMAKITASDLIDVI